MSDDFKSRFAAIAETTVEEQANTFLRSFVMEFQGNFEEVLELAQQFKKFCKVLPTDGKVRELDEVDAHYFLEKRGETMTIKELRDHIAEIDLEKNHNVTFMEYVLYKYNKSLKELFAPPGGASPEALAALEKAIELYAQVLAERQAREDKMAALEKTAALGGVKGLAAKNELDQMKAADLLQQNKKEITAAATKRKAEKNAQDGSKEREKAEKAERARLAEEEKKKAEETAKLKADSKARLAAKAALFQGK